MCHKEVYNEDINLKLVECLKHCLIYVEGEPVSKQIVLIYWRKTCWESRIQSKICCPSRSVEPPGKPRRKCLLKVVKEPNNQFTWQCFLEAPSSIGFTHSDMKNENLWHGTEIHQYVELSIIGRRKESPEEIVERSTWFYYWWSRLLRVCIKHLKTESSDRLLSKQVL